MPVCVRARQPAQARQLVIAHLDLELRGLRERLGRRKLAVQSLALAGERRERGRGRGGVADLAAKLAEEACVLLEEDRAAARR